MKIQINPSDEIIYLVANWLLVTIAAFLQWFTIENPLGIHWILFNLILAIVLRALYLIVAGVEHLITRFTPLQLSGGILTLFFGLAIFLGLVLLVPGLVVNIGYFFTLRALIFGTVVILVNQSRISKTGSLSVTVSRDDNKTDQ